MRILTVSNLYPPDSLGGYELACSQVVDALRMRGHDVLVLTAPARLPGATTRASRETSPAGEDSAGHVLRALELVDDRYWLQPCERFDDAVDLVRDVESRLVSAHNAQMLAATLEQFAPDVVYLNNLVGLGGLGLVALLQHLAAPWVWHLGDCVPADLCCFPFDAVVPELARLFTREVRGEFLVVSRQLRDEIESRGVGLAGRVELAPYWIAGRRQALPARPARTGPLHILFCGWVHAEKGADLLIEAAGLLRAAGYNDFQVDMYGRLGDQSLPQQIRARGLSAHVRLCGPRPHHEILERYADYDVLAFPTRAREPFGIVPLEALARGCVPIMSRRCGVAEWLVHGVHCLKAARSASAYSRVFQAILDGEVDLAPLAARGRAAVWRDFHIEAILPQIEHALARAARAANHRHISPQLAASACRLARLAERVALELVRSAAIA